MAGAAGAADGTAAWARLAEPSAAPLLEALRGIDAAPSAGVIERLRKAFPVDTVTAAIELSIARTRAHDKFGERAGTLWCDRPGVEMASSPATAAWKAARFREAGAARIDDLCCGIGGDLMELARVADAVGVDMQPLRAWMAARNASCTVRCADAVAEPGDAPFAHADPARRAGGGRIHRAEDLLPSLESLRASMRGRAGGAIKLGPGMDLGWGEVDADDEVEFIGEHGRLVQQVLWSGALVRRPGARTVIPGLYLAGGGVHPGAGIPMATLSGRHAAEAIMQDRALISRSARMAMPGGMSTASPTTGVMPSRSSPS
jgi:hypothetical protein